jgi:hypothetical protein
LGNHGSHAIASIKVNESAFVYKGKAYHRSHVGRYGSLYLMNRNNIVRIHLKKLVRMFVALGSNKNIIGFGIIEDISRHTLYIKSDVSKFDKIYLSNSAISEDNPSEFRIID